MNDCRLAYCLGGVVVRKRATASGALVLLELLRTNTEARWLVIHARQGERLTWRR